MNFSEIARDGRAFNALMESIDERMKQEGVGVPARSLDAMRRISEMFRCAIALSDPLAGRINDWFVARYGDRLGMDMSLGRTVVNKKGDPYLVRFPLIWGSRKVNPLTWIVGVTDSMWRALKEHELDALASRIISVYQQLVHFTALSKDSTLDLFIGVDLLTQQQPAYGLSRWASLQSAEKTLKEFIGQHGGTPPRTHKLAELACKAESLGLPTVDRAQLSDVQCSPGVRYDVPVTFQEALTAHYSAFAICSHVGTYMDRSLL